MEKSNKTYRTRAVTFVEKVIKVRRQLVRMGKHRDAETLQVLVQLDSQFQYSRVNFTQEGAARFIERYQDKIRMLIPGKLSRCHKSFVNELEELLKDAPLIASNS